jgi:hypothetical protein
MQHLVVVGDDLQEYLGREVFNVFGLQRHTPLVGGEVDDVVNQPEVAVNEVVPRTFMVLQTPLQEGAVYGCEWHE